MLSIQRKQAGGTALLSWVCLFALLAASINQAAHLCRPQGLDGGDPAQSCTLSSASAPFCLTCLMSQPGTALVLFLTLSPVLFIQRRMCLFQARPRVFRESFPLTCVLSLRTRNSPLQGTFAHFRPNIASGSSRRAPNQVWLSFPD